MKRSAGILVWRRADGHLEVLLGHPGGPLFARKDDGYWSIPKGEYEPEETPWAAAAREFQEETGHRAPDGPALDLGELAQRGGKVNHIFAVNGDLDAGSCSSNMFEMVWRGRRQQYPEMDRFDWFDLSAAEIKIFPSQRPFLDALRVSLDRTQQNTPSTDQ